MQAYCGFRPVLYAAYISPSGESPAGTQHEALTAVLVITAWQERRSSSELITPLESCAVFAIAVVLTLWIFTWWWTADALDSLLGKQHTTFVQVLAFLMFYAPASTILASWWCAWCGSSAHALLS
jgi:hypothetical protein